MTFAHLIKSKDGTMVLGLDVAAGGLTYSLESLPALLGNVQFGLLVRALGLHQEIASIPEAERGAFVAKALPGVADATMSRIFEEQNRSFEDFGLMPLTEPEGSRGASREGAGSPARQNGRMDSHPRPSHVSGLGG